jgi:hypothetical protein
MLPAAAASDSPTQQQVYETLKASLGVEVAQRTSADNVRRAAIEQGAGTSAEDGGRASMQTFIDRQEQWRRGGALELEERSADSCVFKVTRCAHARMYCKMGLGDIGHLLSCQRDGTFCEGHDPKLRPRRTQTIKKGASHCDLAYSHEKG